jgi:hypothetical protein
VLASGCVDAGHWYQFDVDEFSHEGNHIFGFASCFFSLPAVAQQSVAIVDNVLLKDFNKNRTL